MPSSVGFLHFLSLAIYPVDDGWMHQASSSQQNSRHLADGNFPYLPGVARSRGAEIGHVWVVVTLRTTSFLEVDGRW